MSEVRKFSLVKPSTKTPFYIDFDWWKQTDNNWRIFLRDSLCLEHQNAFADSNENQMIDWIDPDTAQVKPVDGLQHVLITHCAKQEDFLTDHTTLIDGVFRLLLANGNLPMTPVELSMQLNRPADLILRTISGPRVYKGIRPRQK